ncbi:hypothetical protein V1514DRAFT_351591 [Lipomyces japonicus]|uniref:uncharacterized protein n=1 Tax=Lipomyces japonicus TaxID=56871 RepID=UPI0034CEAA81
MAETSTPLSTAEVSEVPEVQSAEEKARIRRERREARILAGGTSRLNKITNVAHGGEAPTYKQHVVPTHHLSSFDDPPEVAPSESIDKFSDNPLIQILNQQQQQYQQSQLAGADPFGLDDPIQDIFKRALAGNNSQPNAGLDEPGFDLFAQLMQNIGSGSGGVPPSFQTGGAADNSGNQTSTTEPASKDNSIFWRFAHSSAIIFLAVYIFVYVNIDGTQLTRLETNQKARPLFWYFATVETALQSGRYFFEQGRAPTNTIAKFAGYLPPPYSSYLILAARYLQFFTNIFTDFSLFVFLLGIIAWVKGL